MRIVFVYVLIHYMSIYSAQNADLRLLEQVTNTIWRIFSGFSAPTNTIESNDSLQNQDVVVPFLESIITVESPPAYREIASQQNPPPSYAYVIEQNRQDAINRLTNALAIERDMAAERRVYESVEHEAENGCIRWVANIFKCCNPEN